MKEMVRAIFAPGLTAGAVGELLDRLLSRLSRCRLWPFIRLGKTIRRHRDGILAARRLKLSNVNHPERHGTLRLWGAMFDDLVGRPVSAVRIFGVTPPALCRCKST